MPHVLFPWLKRITIDAEIKVGVENGVVGDAPKRTGMFINDGPPQLLRTALNRLAKHPQSGAILALKVVLNGHRLTLPLGPRDPL
jgi:hypothetical protein